MEMCLEARHVEEKMHWVSCHESAPITFALSYCWIFDVICWFVSRTFIYIFTDIAALDSLEVRVVSLSLHATLDSMTARFQQDARYLEMVAKFEANEAESDARESFQALGIDEQKLE